MFNLQEILESDMHFLSTHGHIFVAFLVHIFVAVLVHIYVAFLVHIFVRIFVAFLSDTINRFYSTDHFTSEILQVQMHKKKFSCQKKFMHVQ